MGQTETPQRRWKWLGLALTAFPVLALASMFTRFTVAGSSMVPTLLPGDRLLVRRGRRGIRVGDLVVVTEPGGLAIVKRLAGKSGDVVQLGERTLTLGAGEVAVLGDYTSHSTDSRRWGPLPEGALRGRVTRIYYPADRAGRCTRG